jgi:hypothetical protein
MQRMNTLLSDPAGIDIDELLRDGRIGLYVVSTLAHRHGIRVQLQSNIYGGTSAIIVLPTPLLDGTSDHQLPRTQEQEAALAAGAPAFSGRLAADVPAGSALAADVPAGGALAGGGSVGGPPAGHVLVSETWAEPGEQAETQVRPQDRWHPQSSRRPFATPPLPTPSPRQTRGERPPLPKRQAQASLAPELRDRLGDRPTSSARRTEPPGDQLTGLMADFLKGVSRSAEEEPPSGTGTAR